MERREFVAAAVGAAAALSATRALAEDQITTPHAQHMMHGPKFQALMKTSAECVSTGNECLRHCFGMLSMNDTSMVACTKAAYDLVSACAALESHGGGQFAAHADFRQGGRRRLHGLQEGMRPLPANFRMQGLWRLLQGLRGRVPQGLGLKVSVCLTFNSE